MDKSFHSPLITRSPFSPRTNQSIPSKRSLLPGFRTPSRVTSSIKSVQSMQVILRSAQNFVEGFGQPLPVIITEAITFADRNAVVSSRISQCGYAWVVCGRRLLIWQYRQSVGLTGTPQKKQLVNSQCFELLLPQSDLAHRAELVSVFVSSTSHTPSCIAVSPEGVVRYWPSVIHDGVSVEQVADLQGQECDSLTDIGDLGCILATTTCSVVWIQPHLSAGRPNLICHNLRTPTGWLGGITKKMSSFIFGPMSSEQSAETRLVRVLSVQENDNSWLVYVLAGHSLQKWRLSSTKEEMLIFVVELNQFIRDGFRSTIWEQSGGDPSEIDTWLLDIQSDKDNIIILAAAVNMHVSPQVHYAMVSVQTNLPHPPNNIRDLLVLKMNGLYREDSSSDSLAYRFLLCGTCAYLYNQRTITIFKPQEEPDVLEFHGLSDFILGGAICVNTPIFFLRNHGLVTISHNESGMDFNISTSMAHLESLNESGLGNLSVYNMDADEMYSTDENTVTKMKAAFIYHLQKQKSACQDIMQEIFVPEPSFTYTINSTLDKCVVSICQELLDDTPAGDPRWSHKTQVGIGSSYAMQVLHQLQDKRKALNLFIRFLQELELWNYLGVVSVRDSHYATVHLLGEFMEKIVAGIALKRNSTNSVFIKAVEMYELDSQIPKENGLTKQDILFSKVTQIHQVLQALINHCDEAVHSDLNPMEIIELIKETNGILLEVLKDINQFRYQNKDNYAPQDDVLNFAPDFLPWTAAVGFSGLHDVLILQQSITYNYGAKIASDNNIRITLYDQLTSLIDFILDGYKTHLDSLKGTSEESVLTRQYQSDRHKLISPLIVEKEFERASLLAEKYLDFETLIMICEVTKNHQKLRNYFDRYNSQGFHEFLYKWYLQENQPGKLIDLCKKFSKTESNQLTTFLGDHPSLLWIQNIYEDKFSSAANILRDLALKEKELVVRQKTMFSLSKLAKLTTNEADTNDYVDFIDSQLELISIQEEIPDYVLQRYGYDSVNIKVIPPGDLIHLYTCVEYKEAGDIEFKKALDLLQYINDTERRSELLLEIWKAAILRDSWLEGNLDSPMEVLQNTLFFKLADLAYSLGGDPYDFLPPLDSLTDALEMTDIQENKHFQFLIKTAYEYFYGLKSD